MKEVSEAVKEAKIPERFIGDVLTAILNKALDRNGNNEILNL